MNIPPVSELTLYRYRYAIGHVLLGLLIIGLLALNFQSLPPGLSDAEQQSAIISHSITAQLSLGNPLGDVWQFLQTTHAIDLPYHLLQKASLSFFGLSPLGVRLPSVVLTAISAFMLFLLLRRWLQDNAAVVMGVLVVTSAWLLSIGRVGTPEIMAIFWSALLLLIATYISQESRHQHLLKAGGLLAAIISVYTPSMAYFFLAVVIAAITQPHVRYLLRATEKFSFGVSLLLFTVILLPLGFHVWREPTILRDLLTIPDSLPGPLAFLQNLVQAGSHICNPFIYTIGQVPFPLLSIPMSFMTVIGFVRLIVDWHSVRSHILLFWLAILLPLIGLGATSQTYVALFVPITLLAAIGVQSLFRYWYKIFPRNPYARVFGLLPLSILMLSMITFNYQRFFVAVPHAQSTVQIYDPDPFVLHRALASKTYTSQRLLVIAPPEKVMLYSIDKHVAKNLEIVSAAQFVSIQNATSVIVAEGEMANLTAIQRGLLPTGKLELLVNDRKDKGLRFRVFTQ